MKVIRTRGMKKKELEECEEKGQGRKVEKGVAFPTCYSVNEIAGHFSPIKQDTYSLKTGYICKIGFGAHIDGFISVVANTIVIPVDEGKEYTDIKRKRTGLDASGKVSDNRADVVVAA